MLRVLVIVLCPNRITGLSLITGERQIPLIVSLCVVGRVRGTSSTGFRSHTKCGPTCAWSHGLGAILHGSLSILLLTAPPGKRGPFLQGESEGYRGCAERLYIMRAFGQCHRPGLVEVWRRTPASLRRN